MSKWLQWNEGATILDPTSWRRSEILSLLHSAEHFVVVTLKHSGKKCESTSQQMKKWVKILFQESIGCFGPSRSSECDTSGQLQGASGCRRSEPRPQWIDEREIGGELCFSQLERNRWSNWRAARWPQSHVTWTSLTLRQCCSAGHTEVCRVYLLIYHSVLHIPTQSSASCSIIQKLSGLIFFNRMVRAWPN